MLEITQRKGLIGQVIEFYCVFFLFIRSCTLKTRGSANNCHHFTKKNMLNQHLYGSFMGLLVSCSPAKNNFRFL